MPESDSVAPPLLLCTDRFEDDVSRAGLDEMGKDAACDESEALVVLVDGIACADDVTPELSPIPSSLQEGEHNLVFF